MRSIDACLCALLLACGCARELAFVSAPQFPEGEGQVLHEDLSLECAGPRSEPRCELVAEYEVVQATPETRVEIMFKGVETLELATTEATLAAVAEEPGLGLSATRVTYEWVSHELDGVGLRHLYLRAEFSLKPKSRLRLHWPAAYARHLAFAQILGLQPCAHDRRGCRFALSYKPAERGYSLRTSGPSSWSLEVSRDPEVAVVEILPGPATIAPGGPLLGLGVGWRGETPVTKLRVGWEIFAPRFVAHSLAVEVDGERRVTMAFAGELVSPMLLFLPSFGLGLGLPVELAPTPIAGVRAQLSVQFPYLGVVATLDVFPSQPEPRVSPSIYAQLSF